MKRLNVVVVWLVLLSMLLAACTAATPAPATQPAAQQPPAAQPTAAAPAASGGAQTIKVGGLYPLTGPDAGWAGDPYIKSHQLAIDEINAAGGIKCLNGAKLNWCQLIRRARRKPAIRRWSA